MLFVLKIFGFISRSAFEIMLKSWLSHHKPSASGSEWKQNCDYFYLVISANDGVNESCPEGCWELCSRLTEQSCCRWVTCQLCLPVFECSRLKFIGFVERDHKEQFDITSYDVNNRCRRKQYTGYFHINQKQHKLFTFSYFRAFENHDFSRLSRVYFVNKDLNCTFMML